MMTRSAKINWIITISSIIFLIMFIIFEIWAVNHRISWDHRCSALGGYPVHRDFQNSVCIQMHGPNINVP
jgi:hypothetical protein